MKPLCVYTRPMQWQGLDSDKLELMYVPITAGKFLKRSGAPGRPDDHYLRAHPDGVKQLVDVLRARKPQVLLRWINTGLHQEAHERIKRASPGIKTVVVDGNQPDKVHKYALRYRDMIDLFLVNSRDRATRAKYAEVGIAADTLYEGFDPKTVRGRTDRPNRDCFFAGSNRRHKVKDPESLRRMWEWDFPGGKFRFDFISAVQRSFRLVLHGSRKEWPMPRSFKIGPPLKWPGHVRQFRRVKIVLCCSHYPDIHRFYTRRLIHSGASGRAVVARYVDGMERDFGYNGQHIAWFKTVGEGIELVKKYLKDDKERERMAARCARFFARHHSWEARLREFEGIVGRLL